MAEMKVIHVLHLPKSVSVPLQVFSAVVLEEFLKELAAMAQEHALFIMLQQDSLCIF